MQKTIKQAITYARMLANLHNASFCVVELPEAAPGSARDFHKVTGKYYGGVRSTELSEWTEDRRCTLLHTISPS